jgi:hypothetical protein
MGGFTLAEARVWLEGLPDARTGETGKFARSRLG